MWPSVDEAAHGGFPHSPPSVFERKFVERVWRHGRPDASSHDAVSRKLVIANLLDNGIKYSPAGGDVEVTVATNGAHAFVSVRDHGIGIRQEDLGRLFTRFGRLVTDENQNIPGAGLGLFLCREIARRHGGDILVESWWGAGSRFTLSLPLTRVPAPIPA